jgi:hypothetical protein
MHTYMHACKHAYMHTHIHTYIHTYINTYKYTYICIHMHTWILTHAYAHTGIQTYVHRHLYVCMLACRGYTQACIHARTPSSLVHTHTLSYTARRCSAPSDAQERAMQCLQVQHAIIFMPLIRTRGIIPRRLFCSKRQSRGGDNYQAKRQE